MTHPESPRTVEQIVDAEFLEHRAKLLDVAAFLDRIDRAAEHDTQPQHDPRIPAIRAALNILRDGQSERARRVLELWSDPTEALLDQAPNTPVLGVASPPERQSAN
ncbi:MAG: hypothetical protein AAGF84_10310 [Planctomycetota bacterium]